MEKTHQIHLLQKFCGILAPSFYISSDEFMTFLFPLLHHDQKSETPHDKTNKMACAPSKDSESSLSTWRKFGSLATHWAHSRRLWSGWADAQADLCLHWTHMPFCWFWHEVEPTFGKPTDLSWHQHNWPLQHLPDELMIFYTLFDSILDISDWLIDWLTDWCLFVLV